MIIPLNPEEPSLFQDRQQQLRQHNLRNGRQRINRRVTDVGQFVMRLFQRKAQRRRLRLLAG